MAENPPPAGHDVIVIGASAGGLQVLQRILRDLPDELPATVLIVQHVGRISVLPDILNRAGKLPVQRAESGARLEHGQVLVAPPGRHMLVHDGHVLLRRGPQENLARPAIDPLFRSAAASCGGRLIGVILSGALNDGTAGLRAVKRCGGLAVVQDPADAAVLEMPQSALRHVAADHCCPAAKLGQLLARLAVVPAGPTPPIPIDIRLEAAIAAQELGDMSTEDRLGTPSRFACPECHGTLWEIDDGSVLRYRCHVGHAFTGETMATAQSAEMERMLWRLLRSHEERAALVERLAAREMVAERAAELRRRAREAEDDAELVRRLMNGKFFDGADDGGVEQPSDDAI